RFEVVARAKTAYGPAGHHLVEYASAKGEDAGGTVRSDGLHEEAGHVFGTIGYGSRLRAMLSLPKNLSDSRFHWPCPSAPCPSRSIRISRGSAPLLGPTIPRF